MTRRPALATLLLAAAVAAAPRAWAQSCSPELFAAAARYDVPINPYTIAVGQFDGDGIPDLAAAGASFGASGLVVLPGNGDGSFGAPIVTDVYDVALMAAADFNGDGFTDIALDIGEHHITVYISNGDGTFQPGTEVGAVQFPSGMKAAALMPGGPVDLVLPGDGGTIYVIPGNGDATFGTPIESSSISGDIAIGDLNGDGKPDVVGTGDGTILVSLGRGDRTFDPPKSFAVAPNLGSIAIGDVDGDGHADVGVAIDDYAEVVGGFVGILKGNGDGTLQAAVETSVGQAPRSLSFADLDGDGALDAVVAADGFVTVLRGVSSTVFASRTAYIADGAADFGGAGALAVADFDGDGVPDVATGNQRLATVGVLLGQGDGTLRAANGFAVHTEFGVSDFTVGDLDGDAVSDLVVIGDGLRLFPGLGRGSFGPPETLLGTDANARGASVGDFDGDGRLDLAVSVSSFELGTGVAIYLQKSDGMLSDPTVYPSSGAGPGRLVPADYDGNGSLDAVSLTGNGSGTSLVFFPGDGHGALGGEVLTPVAGSPQDVTAADFNGDGKVDLATIEGVFQSINGVLRIFLSNGDGTFTDEADYDLDSLPYGVAAGNVAGGAAADVVVAGGFGGSLLFVGNGDGTLQAPAPLPVTDFSDTVAIADFDGDGLGDVVVSTFVSDGIAKASLLVATPGGFDPPVDYSVARIPFVSRPYAFEGSAPGVAFMADNGVFTFLANTRLTALALPASRIVGQAAVLHASASGYGPVGYQWRKDGAPLSDGGAISGSTTATLTIDPVSFADAGSYDVLVTDSCSSTASNTAALSVEFADVPASSPFHDDIIAIATEGVTGGCGGGNYCPASPVRRDQMAVFLLKSEHGSDYVPPACSGVFADVPCASPFAPWIEQLAAEGVTGGCGGGNYCPDQSVTRAQMAIFLLKTSLGSSYSPPTPVGLFGDVPVGSFGAGFIEDLYTRGITGGCQTSPLLYCPASAVLRQQMATFLVRTFHP